MRSEPQTPQPAQAGDLRRARALLDLGRLEAATEAVRRALARAPHDAEALELLGLVLIRQGLPAEARTHLGAALALDPRRAHLHYLLGFAAGMLGDQPRSEAELSEAVRLEPEEPVYLRALAEHFADRGRPAEGIPLAERAVTIDPERASNHRTLGYVASAAKDGARAERCYRRALELDPQDAVVWNNLGCVLLARGERLQAREHFREALRLDPRGQRARDNLALVAPARRPPSVHKDFDAFLGEAVRELFEAGRLDPSLRTAALALAVGQGALSHALKGRLEARGTSGRVAATVGTMAAGMVARRLRGASLPAVGLLALVGGAGYLAAAHRITPERRRFVEIVAAARREWNARRQDWLDGKLSRQARELAVERQLEQLALALDRADPVTAGDAPTDEQPAGAAPPPGGLETTGDTDHGTPWR